MLGKTVERAACVGEEIGASTLQRCWSQPDHGLALHDRRAIARQHRGKIGRQVGGVAARAQDMRETIVAGVMERRMEAAQRAESRFGPVGDALQAQFLAPAHDDAIALNA